MFIKFKNILKQIIILVIIINYSHVSAATIEIKDSTELVENYALYGAANICRSSDKLLVSQKLEMKQIEEHYKKILISLLSKKFPDMSTVSKYPDMSMAWSASKEKFGLEVSMTISYKNCSILLKK